MATRTPATSTLSPAEKRKIAMAAKKGLGALGRPLTAEQRDEIFANVQALKKSKKPVIGKEAIALWAAKIDYAIANGDKLNLGKLLKSPGTGPELAASVKQAQARFYDSNGGCSCGSGGGGGSSGW